MAVTQKYYDFADIAVPSALDPDVIVNISAGRHVVLFDEMISRKGNGSECEIRWNQRMTRVEISVLSAFEDDGLVVYVGDA